MRAKPYTWDEIKDILIKELSKTKHIMTFGTIGSCDVNKDIDSIITKKPSSKTKDFYKEIHSLFFALDKFFAKKYNAKAVRFSTSVEQFLIAHISNKRNDLNFHTMIYTNFNQILKDWGWAIFEDHDIKKILLKNYKCLLGNPKDLFRKEFQVKSYYDSIYIFLCFYDKINSHLPKNLFIEIMNNNLDYLYRKRLGIKYIYKKDKRGIIKSFYKLCDETDKRNKIR